MKKNSVQIDLSRKTPEEIAEFMFALNAARRFLAKKGFSVKVRRKRKPQVKLPR